MHVQTDGPIIIEPQPGPQTEFAESPADIAIMGGKAFGGKTYSLLLQPLLHIGDPSFGALIFRRTYTEIKDEGGMWDEAESMYHAFGATAITSPPPRYQFPSGARVRFTHMEHEQDRFRFKGAQIPLLEFDQVETFTWKQFSYVVGRNRSTQADIWPYCRATANPVPDDDLVGGWLRRFIDWWIGTDGYAMPERSGVIRWYVMEGDEVVWYDKPDGLDEPVSVTFIAAGPEDNRIGMQADPTYMSKLKNLPLVDRQRLLHGNWNARDRAGSVIKRLWIETNLVDSIPVCDRVVRCWDRAATDENEPGAAKASWTAGAKVGIADNELTYLINMRRVKKSAHAVRELIQKTAEQDGHDVQIIIYHDPGGAGKAEVQDMVRGLAGYNVQAISTHARKLPTGLTGRNNKVTYALPWASQLEAGNFKVMREGWTAAFIAEADNFDGTGVCDQTDAVSGAYHALVNTKRGGTWGTTQ